MLKIGYLWIVVQVRDRAWFAQTMLYLTCTIISKVDLARYGVSRAKDWVFVDYGTIFFVHCLKIYPAAIETRKLVTFILIENKIC